MVVPTCAAVNVTLPNGSLLTWDEQAKTATIQARNPGAKADVYLVTETPILHGRVFLFSKPDGSYYVVTVADGQFVLDHECDCKGFASHKHCKHADAAVAISDRMASMIPVAVNLAPGCRFNTARDLEADAAYRW